MYQSQGTPNQENLDQIAVSPTAKILVADDDLGNVYVWDLSGGAPVILAGAATKTTHSGDMKVAFSPDGKTLAIAGSQACGCGTWPRTPSPPRWPARHRAGGGGLRPGR